MFFIRLKKGLFRIGENRRATHALLIILILFSTQINECKNAPLETTTNLVQQSRTVANLTSIKLEISQHENTKLISSNDSIAAKSSPIVEVDSIKTINSNKTDVVKRETPVNKTLLETVTTKAGNEMKVENGTNVETPKEKIQQDKPLQNETKLGDTPKNEGKMKLDNLKDDKKSEEKSKDQKNDTKETVKEDTKPEDTSKDVINDTKEILKEDKKVRDPQQSLKLIP